MRGGMEGGERGGGGGGVEGQKVTIREHTGVTN